MPSLVRGRPSGSGLQQRRVDLPEYQPLQYALTPKAQQELSALTSKHSLRTLDTLLTDALTILTDNVAGVNDTYYQQEAALQARKRKVQSREGDNDEQDRISREQAELEDTRIKVEEMTSRMDDHMRRTIDSQQMIDHVRDAIKTLTRDAGRGDSSSQPVETQQATSQRRNVPGAFETDDDDQPPATFTPTEAGMTQDPNRVPPLNAKFADLLSKKKDRYEAHTRRQRYSANNHYRQFRRVLHDAQHPDDDVPMPHESTWFPEESAPAPGTTVGGRQRRGAGAAGAGSEEEDEDEDDLAVARETISTKCPLTLRDFVDPVTSRKCPHSFEREAIEGLIEQSALRLTSRTDGGAASSGPIDLDGVEGGSGAVAPHLQSQVPAGSQLVSTQGRGGRRGGRGAAAGTKAVQCPVPGCSNLLTREDLFVDQVLTRKIARLLRAQRALDEEDDDESDVDGDGAARPRKRRRDGRSVVSLGSGDDISDDEDEVVTGTARRRIVKGERRASQEL